MAKNSQNLQKDGQKVAKTSFKHLKYALLLNNILRPFKNSPNHTKKGQKGQKISKIQQKLQINENNGKKRTKTAFKHLRYAPIRTTWLIIHWSHLKIQVSCALFAHSG